MENSYLENWNEGVTPWNDFSNTPTCVYLVQR